MSVNFTVSEKVFTSVYARNCEVLRIDRAVAAAFLEAYHALGDTRSRYCYGVYVLHEGHSGIPEGTLVAVGTFSSARRWMKDGREVRSYEWVRYASLSDVRVIGGMGKILDTFVNEVHPDDVMSYADASWSNGDAYKKLGFTQEESKTFPGGAVSLKFRKRFP